MPLLGVADCLKALEILNGIKVFETVATQTSKDGKTINITVKPAEGLRLGDAARLALRGSTASKLVALSRN